MRRRRRTVIVVSHEASRTGAPIVAGAVLRALRKRGVPTHLVLRWGGPLESALRAAADSASLEPMRRARAQARRAHRHRLARVIEGAAATFVLLWRRPAVVWANTLLSGSWVGPALRLRVPVIFHAHELEPLTSSILDRFGLEGRWDKVRLVACSDAARRDLARAAAVPLDRVTLLRSLVDQEEVLARAAGPRMSAPTDDHLVGVGACGTADRRKGFDMFLELARRVRANSEGRPVGFRWVGRADYAARAAAAAAGVELVGEVADAMPELAAMDVVVVPSRADAFPLVVLEAMTLGRPIVAFAVGGLPEQIGDSGVLVPPEDVEAMSVAVLALLDDRSARDRFGRAASARARGQFGFDRFEREVGAIIASVLPPDAPQAARRPPRRIATE